MPIVDQEGRQQDIFETYLDVDELIVKLQRSGSLTVEDKMGPVLLTLAGYIKAQDGRIAKLERIVKMIGDERHKAVT
jgi:hypothetical protein